MTDEILNLWCPICNNKIDVSFEYIQNVKGYQCKGCMTNLEHYGIDAFPRTRPIKLTKKKVCCDCKWWVQVYRSIDDVNWYGTCQRRSPGSKGYFPTTTNCDFCGDYGDPND